MVRALAPGSTECGDICPSDAVHVHEQEAGGIPDLVGEGAVALGAALGLKAMSVPGEAMDASVKRAASVPYFSMTSSGSMTLPLVLDIFWRSASRTSAWM